MIKNFEQKRPPVVCTLPHKYLITSLLPAETGGLLCFKGSDKSRRCWRRCGRNWPVTDLWLWVWTARNDEALSFLCVCVPTCTHLYQLTHLVARWTPQPPRSYRQAQRQGSGGRTDFSSSSLPHVPVAVVIAIHPRYKKPRIRVEFFHQNPTKVKGHNIGVWSEHLGLLGTWRPWASDSHNILGGFIWFSLKSLYLQPHVHYCTNTRDATGLPKPHHSLPACDPQREREGEEREVVFLRTFDLSPVSGWVSSRKKNK